MAFQGGAVYSEFHKRLGRVNVGFELVFFIYRSRPLAQNVINEPNPIVLVHRYVVVLGLEQGLFKEARDCTWKLVIACF